MDADKHISRQHVTCCMYQAESLFSDHDHQSQPKQDFMAGLLGVKLHVTCNTWLQSKIDVDTSASS